MLAEEKTLLYGLVVRERKIAYGNVDSKHATELFIRGALVEENLFPEPRQPPRERDEAKLSASQLLLQAREATRNVPAAYDFLEQNRQVRHKIETWQTRMRRHDLADLDQALFDFYARRIEGVSSLDELNRWQRDHPEPSLLRATETDLVGVLDLTCDEAAFPDHVRLGGQAAPLSYAYSPGEDWDGVTIKLDAHAAEAVSPATAEWAVPGLREGIITELLRALPKALRRELMPLPPKVAEIVRDLRPGGASLKQDLARFIRQRYGLEIPPAAWPLDAIPKHLRPRIELIGPGQKTIDAGRDLGQLRQRLARVKVEPARESAAWGILNQRWERFGLTGWSFGDLPERVSEGDGTERVEAWLGLQLEEGQVNVRLFRSRETARRASLPGLQRLVELALQKDLAWLHKDLRAVARFEPLLAGLCSSEQLQAGALANLRAYLLPARVFAALSQEHFRAAVDSARQRLPGLAARMADGIETILKLRLEVLRRCAPAPGPPRPRTLASLQDLGTATAAPRSPGLVQTDLTTLLPGNFLETIPFERLADLPRYLKALRIRAERASVNPAKDHERARLVAPYAEALKQLHATKVDAELLQVRLEEFRWLVEEYKVSVFAQELGTVMRVSPKRLDEHLARVREAV